MNHTSGLIAWCGFSFIPGARITMRDIVLQGQKNGKDSL